MQGRGKVYISYAAEPGPICERCPCAQFQLFHHFQDSVMHEKSVMHEVRVAAREFHRQHPHVAVVTSSQSARAIRLPSCEFNCQCSHVACISRIQLPAPTRCKGPFQPVCFCARFHGHVAPRVIRPFVTEATLSSHNPET